MNERETWSLHELTVEPDVTESHPALPSRFVYSSDLLIVLFVSLSPRSPIPSMNYFKVDSYSLVLTDTSHTEGELMKYLKSHFSSESRVYVS